MTTHGATVQTPFHAWSGPGFAVLETPAGAYDPQPGRTAQMSVREPAEIATAVADAAREGLTTGTLVERVAVLNAVRRALADLSPFAAEPVDFVEWVPFDGVEKNDYNPNQVAPPEMELLRLSIAADGFTQPIVTNLEDGSRVVVDGFHRNRVGREYEDVAARVQGFLPVVQIRAEQTGREDRIASTIRHNRARGKHQVTAMSAIVLELKRRNWSDKKIGEQLGMDPDEVLRLSQIEGLAVAFADRDFSEAWEAVLDIDDEYTTEVIDGGVAE